MSGIHGTLSYWLTNSNRVFDSKHGLPLLQEDEGQGSNRDLIFYLLLNIIDA